MRRTILIFSLVLATLLAAGCSSMQQGVAKAFRIDPYSDQLGTTEEARGIERSLGFD